MLTFLWVKWRPTAGVLCRGMARFDMCFKRTALVLMLRLDQEGNELGWYYSNPGKRGGCVDWVHQWTWGKVFWFRIYFEGRANMTSDRLYRGYKTVVKNDSKFFVLSSRKERVATCWDGEDVHYGWKGFFCLVVVVCLVGGVFRFWL